jgi:uncharacterized protein (DUF4415 family)
VQPADHGVDFAAAERFEWESAAVEIDIRADYGELREIATGFIGDVLYVLVSPVAAKPSESSVCARRAGRRSGTSMDKKHAETMRRARERALKSAAAMTDEEDAAITAAALADPDNPPPDDEFFRRAAPAIEMMPEVVARFRGQRGPQKAPTKQLVSLRLDRDVLEHFRATGPGWQARINAALRKAAKLGKTAHG